MDIKEKQEKLGEVNYIELETFQTLIPALDLSNSQERNINAIIEQANEEINEFYDKGEKVVLFSVPQKIGGKIWITLRSYTVNGSALCVTDRWYNIKLGRRGKLEIDASRWNETKEEPFWISL